MPTRAQYVAQRIGTQMANRGDAMMLRRTTIVTGPVPYRNPPDVSDDLTVTTGCVTGGQAYLGLAGSSVIGRLVAGDQILCAATIGGPVLVTWTVGVMPTSLALDIDGIPTLDGSNNPVTGTAAFYTPDARAANDAWPAIPVSAANAPDPAGSIGNTVQLVFQADQPVVGRTMSFQEMTAIGWVEVDTIGVSIAAYNKGAINPPKVDDLLFVNGRVRSIVAMGQVFQNGVNLLYQVQAR